MCKLLLKRYVATFYSNEKVKYFNLLKIDGVRFDILSTKDFYDLHLTKMNKLVLGSIISSMVNSPKDSRSGICASSSYKS